MSKIKRLETIGIELHKKSKAILYWEDHHIFYQKVNLSWLQKHFDHLFSLPFSTLNSLRSLSAVMHVYILTHQKKAVSVMVLSKVKKDTMEVVNFETFAPFRRNSFATILLNKVIPLLQLQGIKSVHARNRTQWISHPEWQFLLENSHAKLLRTAYTYYQSNPKYVAQNISYLQSYRKESPFSQMVNLNHQPAQEVFMADCQRLNQAEIKDYLNPLLSPKYEKSKNAYSVAMYYKGELIGWILTLKKEERILIWSAYSVPAYRYSGIYFRLLCQWFEENIAHGVQFLVKEEDKTMGRIATIFKKRLHFKEMPQRYYEFTP